MHGPCSGGTKGGLTGYAQKAPTLHGPPPIFFLASTPFRKGPTMFSHDKKSDKDLLKAVNKRLMRAGAGSQARLTAAVQQGTVTLSGTLRHAIQRKPIVKAINGIAGVRRIIDQLQLAPRKTF